MKYLSHVITRPNDMTIITWGDGDSLDRERVRDILLDEYNLVMEISSMGELANEKEKRIVY